MSRAPWLSRIGLTLLTTLPVAAPQPACAPSSLPAAASAVAEPDKHLLFSHDDAGLAFGPESVAGRVAVKAQSLCDRKSVV